MNRLGKILTLGLEEKRAWQLPIIAALLVLFGLGVRWWYNSRAAQGIRLLDMVDIGGVDGVLSGDEPGDPEACRWHGLGRAPDPFRCTDGSGVGLGPSTSSPTIQAEAFFGVNPTIAGSGVVVVPRVIGPSDSEDGGIQRFSVALHEPAVGPAEVPEMQSRAAGIDVSPLGPPAPVHIPKAVADPQPFLRVCRQLRVLAVEHSS